MLDKDKVIIIIYVGTETPLDTYNLINELHTKIGNSFDDSVKIVFLPRYDKIGIEFDCINPVLLDEQEYNKTKEKIKILEENIEKFINTSKNGENQT